MPDADDALTIATKVDATYLTLRREDLAGMQLAYRRDARSWQLWRLLFVGSGTFVATAIIFVLGETLGWSTTLGIACIAFAGTTIGFFATIFWRDRQLRARYQLLCPACHQPLLDKRDGNGQISQTDLVVATGRCPHCEEVVLAP